MITRSAGHPEDLIRRNTDQVNLILLTASYPYIQGTEASFLNIEVEYLAKTFDRVVVVPEIRKERMPLNHPGIRS